MSKHTPGPWSASPSNPERHFEAQVWDADGKALLFFNDGRTIGPEADANARLIAAAPTMAAYIEKRASEGDAEAVSILEAIHASR